MTSFTRRPEDHRDNRTSIEWAAALSGAAIFMGVSLIASRSLGRRSLPDYGDLWRWSTSVSVDGQLTMSEIFSEYELIGHTSILTIPAAHLAATSVGFQAMWLLGIVGYGFTIAAASRVWALIIGQIEFGGWALRFLSLIVGSLTIVRFDVAFSMVNSLLVFEQIYYLLLYLGIWLAASIVYDREMHAVNRRVEGPMSQSGARFGKQIALVLVLVFGDAPSSVLVLVLLAGALYSLVGGSSPYALGLRRTGILAALSVLARWALGTAFGARSTRAESFHLSGLGDAVVDGLRLIGTSIVRPPFDPAGQWFFVSTLGLGLCLATLWFLAALKDFRFSLRTREPRLEAVLFIIGLGTLVTAALSIGHTRDLQGAFHVSRFPRATALGGLLTAYAIVRLWPKNLATLRPLHPRFVVTGFVLVVLFWRAASLGEFVLLTEHESGRQVGQSALICEQENDVEAWRRIWLGFNDERVSLLQSDALFPDLPC